MKQDLFSSIVQVPTVWGHGAFLRDQADESSRHQAPNIRQPIRQVGSFNTWYRVLNNSVLRSRSIFDRLRAFFLPAPTPAPASAPAPKNKYLGFKPLTFVLNNVPSS